MYGSQIELTIPIVSLDMNNGIILFIYLFIYLFFQAKINTK
jgi:hypothetical protein